VVGKISREPFERVQLLIQNQSALRGFIISLIPGSPDVEDVLQDTNVILWEKIETFKPGTDFRAWAFTVAKNVTMAHLRKVKRDRSPSISEELINAVASTWFAREVADPSDREIALDRCLAELSDADREIVNARYHAHGGLEAYSSRVGRSGASLRVSLFRIRAKLRECVRRRLSLDAITEGGTP
jgi:RNA polymerase sigma-70 factor (ECF subfamily)